MAININGTDYCFECKTCAFREFMKKYGIDINFENCWIDCTVPIHEEVDSVFRMIILNTACDKNGSMVYFGNIPLSKLGGPPAS